MKRRPVILAMDLGALARFGVRAVYFAEDGARPCVVVDANRSAEDHAVSVANFERHLAAPAPVVHLLPTARESVDAGVSVLVGWCGSASGSGSWLRERATCPACLAFPSARDGGAR